MNNGIPGSELTASNAHASSGDVRHADVPGDEGGDFGLIDVIEAFVAMRHEWRGQTKETRQLAAELLRAAEQIGQFEATLEQQIAQGDVNEARRLAKTLAELDCQLARSVDAVATSETGRRQRESAALNAVRDRYSSMSRLARWFARPLWLQLGEVLGRQEEPQESAAVEGLQILQSRLRQALAEHEIERIEAIDRAFDPATMYAVASIADSSREPGAVAEQLAPAYRWRSELLSYAQVRVAK